MNVSFAIQITAHMAKAEPEAMVNRATALSPYLIAPLDLLINQAALTLPTHKHERPHNGRKKHEQVKSR